MYTPVFKSLSAVTGLVIGDTEMHTWLCKFIYVRIIILQKCVYLNKKYGIQISQNGGIWNGLVDTVRSYTDVGSSILMALLVTTALFIHIRRRRAMAATSLTQPQCLLSVQYSAGGIPAGKYLGLDI
jgi:hypothetical protein